MTDDERQRLARLLPNLKRRASIHQITRCFFDEQGFLEVDTPVRSPAIAPEKEILPFESDGWFLTTSPELYMKRLLAAGYTRLYQFSHCFRKGERGRLHNPEFTLLEWYRIGANYMDMMTDAECLVLTIARELGYGNLLQYRGKTIDLTIPWPRITVSELFHRLAGWDPVLNPDLSRFDEDMVVRVIPHLNPYRPTIMLDYPAPMASLARLKRDEPSVAERAEVFIGGLELANAYSELTDAKEQIERFHNEIEHIRREQGRTMPLPQKFLESLEHLPECGGIALGMDRLVMLFCDASSIDEVMPFTVDTV
ncbi:MAG TPA: amino acid--tRNA ligase-related protein [Dehalococcoidales bacterium]